jgi:hypothetical protein
MTHNSRCMPRDSRTCRRGTSRCSCRCPDHTPRTRGRSRDRHCRRRRTRMARCSHGTGRCHRSRTARDRPTGRCSAGTPHTRYRCSCRSWSVGPTARTAAGISAGSHWRFGRSIDLPGKCQRTSSCFRCRSGRKGGIWGSSRRPTAHSTDRTDMYRHTPRPGTSGRQPGTLAGMRHSRRSGRSRSRSWVCIRSHRVRRWRHRAPTARRGRQARQPSIPSTRCAAMWSGRSFASGHRSAVNPSRSPPYAETDRPPLVPGLFVASRRTLVG